VATGDTSAPLAGLREIDSNDSDALTLWIPAFAGMTEYFDLTSENTLI
jgi:hypothetical protein